MFILIEINCLVIIKTNLNISLKSNTEHIIINKERSLEEITLSRIIWLPNGKNNVTVSITKESDNIFKIGDFISRKFFKTSFSEIFIDSFF